jgi:hypothetical protein
VCCLPEAAKTNRSCAKRIEVPFANEVGVSGTLPLPACVRLASEIFFGGGL